MSSRPLVIFLAFLLSNLITTIARAEDSPRDLAFRKILANSEKSLEENPQSYLISVPTFAGIAANTQGEVHKKAMAHLKDALSRGAPVNYRDGFGSTALHIVTDGSYAASVKDALGLLLKYGADANQWNGGMQSPWQYYRIVHPEAAATDPKSYQDYDAWMRKTLLAAMRAKPQELELKRLAQLAADSSAEAAHPLPAGVGVAAGGHKDLAEAPAAVPAPAPLHAGGGG